MIYSYVKLRETFICFIFIAIPFHYIQLRVSLNANAFNLTRRLRREIYCQRYCNKILIPVNHQLSLFVCPKHMKSDNW